MNKLAVFVEGQTEQIFMEKLLVEMAEAKSVRIEKRKATGGQTSKRRMRLLEASNIESTHKYYVVIYDCGTDSRVGSDIKERYEGLVASGYTAIIGIRDVYPQDRNDIPKIRAGLTYQLRTSPINVLFVLAVMEIEAWFLAEYTHFSRISSALTLELIKSRLDFDPRIDDMQQRPHPSEDLDAIYGLVGYAYNKSKTNVQRTVNELDYAMVYCELTRKFGDLNNLIEGIDRYFSANSQ